MESKKKTKHKKGVLKKENALRIDIRTSDTGLKTKLFVYNCSTCKTEIRVQSGGLKTHTGKCNSCSQKGRPFEAVYNELCNRQKHHKKEVSITYAEFISFTKIKHCEYCHTTIEWHPHTKIEGKDIQGSRAYHLDRKDNTKGYFKENCVVCCWTCNAAKGSRYSHSDFLEMTRLFRNRNMNKTNVLEYENKDQERMVKLLQATEGIDDFVY